MSVEALREAAALMRELAEAATPGPWEAYRQHRGYAQTDTFGVHTTEGIYVLADHRLDPEDAEHIASWHPAVTLAVADWLDAIVTRIPEIEPHYEHCLDREQTAALAIARAYLGERP